MMMDMQRGKPAMPRWWKAAATVSLAWLLALTALFFLLETPVFDKLAGPRAEALREAAWPWFYRDYRF